jgi:hypothetical protein
MRPRDVTVIVDREREAFRPQSIAFAHQASFLRHRSR